MMPFVGRSIQAKAASNNERRKLDKHEPSARDGSGGMAYCEIELRSSRTAATFSSLDLALSSVDKAVQCQGQ